MIINEDILRRDTVQLLNQINVQIDEVTKVARQLGIEPAQLRDEKGNWPLTPLLLAKAQAYSTLVTLQTRK